MHLLGSAASILLVSRKGSEELGAVGSIRSFLLPLVFLFQPANFRLARLLVTAVEFVSLLFESTAFYLLFTGDARHGSSARPPKCGGFCGSARRFLSPCVF
jgi:hypothetical protein